MLSYSNILEQCNKYYLEKINNKYDIPKEFIVSYLFELVSNILNQEIFDYVYIFKKEDIDFVEKYNINVSDLIIYFRKIYKIKLLLFYIMCNIIYLSK